MKPVILTTLLLTTTLAAATNAQTLSGTDPQVQAMFEQRRAIESTSHTERIRILREAEACIDGAANYRAFRDCERREAQDRQALRDRLRPEIDALRGQWRAFREAHTGR